MKHVSLTPFGRQPMTAGLLRARNLAPLAESSAEDVIEKWAVFDDLRQAKAHFRLTDRDLAVLHALLSFIPGKLLKGGDNLIVFPSNNSLSERTHGMAHSTLRRHLAALVGAGLIWRHDSANGKRFAARDHKGLMVTAFGFDLRPLLLRAQEIGGLADDMREAAQQLQLARQRLVLSLRDCAKLIAFGRQSLAQDGWENIDSRLTPVRAALRRKLSAEILETLQSEVDGLLGDISVILSQTTENLGDTGAQNDCHYSESNKELFVLEPATTTKVVNPNDELTQSAQADKIAAENNTDTPLPFELILEACPDMQFYSPSPIRNWRDLVMMSATLHMMMGIPASIWIEAQRVMGPINAAITLAAMLQRMALIQNPSGYLRKLSSKATEGTYSPTGMIMSLLRPRSPHNAQKPVSADASRPTES